jgi:hypothetical protein
MAVSRFAWEPAESSTFGCAGAVKVPENTAVTGQATRKVLDGRGGRGARLLPSGCGQRTLTPPRGFTHPTRGWT